MTKTLLRAAAIAAALISGTASADALTDLLSGRGVWLQSPKKLKIPDLQRLSDYHVRRVHLMATSPQEKTPTACKDNRGATIAAPAPHQVELVRAARAAGHRVIATFYVYPRDTDIALWTDPNNGLMKQLLDAGAESIEYDLEGQWSKHPACGYPDHKAALADLIARTRALSSTAPIGITTHTGRFPDKNIDFLQADYVSLQAYSTTADNDYGAKQTAALAKLAAFAKPSIIGLAAYQQGLDGSVSKAMKKSMDAAEQGIGGTQKTAGVSYWSSRWILPAASAEGAYLKQRATP